MDLKEFSDQAEAYSARSQRLVGWLVAFAAAIVVLTTAQVTQRKRAKLALAVLGSSIYAASAAVALLGNTG